MTDEEFERLDAELRRLLAGRRKTRRYHAVVAALVRCRDCNRINPEWYMLKRDLWLQAVPGGRGCLCLACLSRRLKRPLVAEDFGELPFDHETDKAIELPFCASL
jgi:hypothetical protein